jgi:NCAIR mutase (PurE)-related protein
MAVSIFMASIEQEHVAGGDGFWPSATASVETTPGIGAPTCLGSPAGLGLAPAP